MTKYIKYHKNYTEFGEPYQLVLPLNLEGLIPDDDSVRLLSHELEDQNRNIPNHFILHNPIQMLRGKVLQKQSVN